MLLDQPCKTSAERGREENPASSTPASTLNATHLFAQSPKKLKSRNPQRERGNNHHRHHRNPKNASVSMAESTQLQQAQLATILGPDPAPIETLISHLMASANEQRSQAELHFNLCKQTDPDSLSLKLFNEQRSQTDPAPLQRAAIPGQAPLQFSPAQEARAMFAILLRKQLTRDDTYLWPRLSPNTQSTLKSIRCCVLGEAGELRFGRERNPEPQHRKEKS